MLYPLAGITVRSARAQAFVRELGRPDVDMTAVRALCFLGCPDEAPAVRLVAWELLLGVLGTQPALWRATKAANRETYRGYVQELDRAPVAPDAPLTVGLTDHPLSTAPESQWSAHFADEALKHEIAKDVTRTQSGLHFFAGDDGKAVGLKRILFVYAKLNKGIRYVQGLNEILAPLYYVAAQGEHDMWNVECDAFFLFNGLLSQIRDRFDRTLDLDVGGGVFSNLRQVETLIALHLPRFRAVLEQFEVSLEFFALRWIVTLGAHDYDLPDLLRLWDSLFAKTVAEFMPFVCLAQCAELWKRVSQLQGQEVEFCDVMPILQSNPREYMEDFDIERLITASEVYLLEEKDRARASRDDRSSLRASGSGSWVASWIPASLRFGSVGK